jgi:uncharacterized membrane protein (UPF0127 family)
MQRLKGLIRSDETSLFIPNCRSIHTWFMEIEIDIVFINHAGMAVGVVERAKPWRILVGPAGTRAVLELPAGATKKSEVRVGDVILPPTP